MADRYGKAYGLTVNFVPEYVKNASQLAAIRDAKPNHIPVFVGAVDNNKTRRIIYDVYSQKNGTYWVDMGNEEFAGQVVCGFNFNEEVKPKLNKPHLFRMPCVIDIFPEIYDAQDKLPDEMSCAEAAESAPQNIMTNITSAMEAMAFLNTILTANAATGDGIRWHAVQYNMRNTSVKTTRSNQAELLSAKFDPSTHVAPTAPEAAPETKEEVATES